MKFTLINFVGEINLNLILVILYSVARKIALKKNLACTVDCSWV